MMNNDKKDNEKLIINSLYGKFGQDKIEIEFHDIKNLLKKEDDVITVKYIIAGFTLGFCIGSPILYYLIHHNINFYSISFFEIIKFVSSFYIVILLIALTSSLIFVLLKNWKVMKNE